MNLIQTAAGGLNAAWKQILGHKAVAAIALIAALGGGWYGVHLMTSGKTGTYYALGTVSRGTIIASLAESGQIAASDSIDIKPQASGTITWVGVKAGQTVRAGQALMSIDSTDARQTLDAAKKSYAAALLQYQKDSATAPINYQNDVQALATAKENLHDDYNTTYNDLSSTYLDLPAIMNGVENTLYGHDFDPKKSLWNMDMLTGLFVAIADTGNMQAFKDASKADYATADSEYTTALTQYQGTTRTSDTATQDALLSATITLVTDVAQALQSELNFLGVVSDVAQTYSIPLPSAFSSVQSNTRTYLATANSDLSTLLSQKKAIDAAKQAITTAEQNVTLDQVGNAAGDNPISLQISKNSLEQQAASIATQESDLAHYTIVAPFAGKISTVDLKVGDSAGSAAAATIISEAQIAQLSLNEVDAAQVAIGDKATLSFDAIDGLTLTGKVVTVDAVGAVSQGVVSYGVEIALDTQDARIKPGMTVNANIETAVHQDVLTVPSSAVKTQNGASYVLAFTPPLPDTGSAQGIASAVAPSEVPVTTGISDDTDIEITSGLAEGEQIVVKTMTGTAAASAASSRTTGTGAARGGATLIRGL